LAQERENAARSFGPSPEAAPSSRQVLIRSLKEGRGVDVKFRVGGASICGTTGASILGDGGGAGGSGLNWEDPGGRICAEAIPPNASTATTVQIMIDECFMTDILFADMKNISWSSQQTAIKLFFRRILDRIEPVGFKTD